MPSIYHVFSNFMLYGKLLSDNKIITDDKQGKILINVLACPRENSLAMLSKKRKFNRNKIEIFNFTIQGEKAEIFNKYTAKNDEVLLSGTIDIHPGTNKQPFPIHIVQTFKFINIKKEIIDDDYEEFANDVYSQYDFLDSNN